VSSQDEPETEDVVATGALEDASRSVLYTAHEAYVRMDAGGFITDVNPAAEATFGWSRSDVVGRVLSDTIIPGRYRDAHLEGLARFLATGEGPVLGNRLELSALHRDGHEFPVEITISARREGATYGFHAFLHDISDRRRAEQYVQTQQAVTAALAEAETVDRAVPGLLRALGEGMGWDVGVYWTPNEAGELRSRALWLATGLNIPGFERLSREIAFAPGVGLPGRVWRDGRPLFIADVATDPALPRSGVAAEAGLHAAVGLPLFAGDGVRGVIEFFARSMRHRERELLDMMSTLSAQIARFIAILAERQDALARLERLALTDELTGLANRRGWNEGLLREVARAHRLGEPLCVALLDIDEFKRFNDEHGHPAGDDALAQTACAWRARLRASDLISRYGGEEFAIAFPAHSIQTAFAVVERLRHAMPAALTCSAGLASLNAAGSADELLGRADTALYDAKRNGRNRTVIAP
jgi:diguanylate cyclase (GGDEF)-like protein/PAS domain S-box-containing protein